MTACFLPKIMAIVFLKTVSIPMSRILFVKILAAIHNAKVRAS